MGKNPSISDELGARAIQGKAYLPGPDDNAEEIIDNDCLLYTSPSPRDS